MFTLRALSRSSKYKTNINAFLPAINAFLDGAPTAIKIFVDSTYQLKQEVENLLAMQTDLYAIDKPICKDGTVNGKCESDLNTLQCTASSFLDQVPDLAEIALGLLEEFKDSVATFRVITQQFRDNPSPKQDETKAFLTTFAAVQNDGHSLVEQFRSLCQIVDDALKKSIFPAINAN